MATQLADGLLAGRYAHRRELGRGASGRVMLVADRVDGALRAAKVVAAEDAERLRWEWDRLSEVSHPQLARVHELVTVDAPLPEPFRLDVGSAVLIEQFVEGLQADEAVAGIHAPAERALFAIRVSEAVARALAAIHRVGLVHGDVKPANIIVADGAPQDACLVDLGLAAPMGVAESISGTPVFLAPEAFLGERNVSTDLFALGVTLRALVRGDLSEEEFSRPSAQFLQAMQPARIRSELGSDIPLSLRRLVGELLESTPALRPRTAGEVARRLRTIAAELGASYSEMEVVDAGPSPLERAAALRALPLVGRETELQQLIDLLGECDVMVVSGVRESGRTRLIREAVRWFQRECSRQKKSAPSYLRVEDALPETVAFHALVHVVRGDVLSLDEVQRFVAASAVDGQRIRVVIEREEEASEVESVHLMPLPREALERLMEALLDGSDANVPAWLEVASEVSAGLPGRLVRIFAEGWGSSNPPERPADLLRIAEGRLIRASVPPGALALAELLAAAGGKLRARVAASMLPDASLQARLLVGVGLASVDQSGALCLRGDHLRALRAQMDEGRRVTCVRALQERAMSFEARAHVALLGGEHAEACTYLARAITNARRQGQPERVSQMFSMVRSELSLTTALRFEWADALRAQAREDAALKALEGSQGDQADIRRAELWRLLGDSKAEVMASRLKNMPGEVGARARVVLARVWLGRGEMTAASALLDSSSLMGVAPRWQARSAETRALVALYGGDCTRARTAARRATMRAREIAAPAEEARAVSVLAMVEQREGRHRAAAEGFERAFELAESAGERFAAASFLVNAGLGRLEVGDVGLALQRLREGARRLIRLKRMGAAARALYNLANAAMLVGEDDLAAESVTRASDWAASENDDETRVFCALVRTELQVRSGQLRTASDELDLVAGNGSVLAGALIDIRRASLDLIAGDVAAGREKLRKLPPSECSTDPLVQSEYAMACMRARAVVGEHEGVLAEIPRIETLLTDLSWEGELRARLVSAESLEKVGEKTKAQAMWAHARRLLEMASLSLSPRGRARLRQLPAYERAFSVARGVQGSAGTPSDMRWRLLSEWSQKLLAEGRMNRLREKLVEAAIELSGAERGFLVVRSGDGVLRSVVSLGLGRTLDEEQKPSLSIASRVMDRASSLVTVDAIEDERLDRAASVHAMNLRSVLCVPLRMRGQRSAALYLDDRLRAGVFGSGEVSLVEALAQFGSVSLHNLELLAEERRRRRRLSREKAVLRTQVEAQSLELVKLREKRHPAFEGIVAQSDAMSQILATVERVAHADAAILIRGESGTGKELIAQALHRMSRRSHAAYVSQNCAALPDTLIESTLFGHVRGAFTGASRAKKGLFEIAHEGTLFLDEIGEMSLTMQAKLLRVIQEGELRPIGSERTRRVDVRLLTATHRDLEQMVEKGTFRADLYYRISVVPIHLPPLRSRPDDIPALVQMFMRRYESSEGTALAPSALRVLQAHHWPGNIRELENEVRRALLLADDCIEAEHLSFVQGDGAAKDDSDELDLKSRVASLERQIITKALVETGGNQSQAARLLGVSRYGLQKMIKRLAIGKIARDAS